MSATYSGIAGVLIGLVAGVLIGKNWLVSTEPTEDSHDRDQVAQRTLLEDEIKDYLATPGEAPLNEEEMLSKILLLFLTDIGLRLSEREQMRSQLLSERRCEQEAPSLTQNDTLNPRETAPDLAKSEYSPKGREGGSVVPFSPQEERGLAEALNIEDALTSLSSLRRTDLASVLASTKDAPIDRVEMLAGHYEGEIVFSEEGKKSHRIQILAKPHPKDGELGGDHETYIWNEEGNQTSRTTGNISGHHYRSSEDASSLIINVRGGSGYIEIWHNEFLRAWIGHYYHREGDYKPYDHAGRVVLYRK